MKTNTPYIAEVQSERDFMLTALAVGAQVGYDASGTTWAIVDEADADPEIIYLPTPRIGSVSLPDGDCAEWTQLIKGPLFITNPEDVYFWVACMVGRSWNLLYSPAHGWAVDADGDICERTWYSEPSVPADRIESYVREADEVYNANN